MPPIEFRVERKFLVSDASLRVLGARLSAVMAQDAHQTGACYRIRSLYFDSLSDEGMAENEAGVDLRRKFRIRLYDPACESMRLEIKDKLHGYTRKTACTITRAECASLMAGELPALGERRVLNALRVRMQTHLLRPKAVIEYERTAFVHPTGNVRVTFDRQIAASACTQGFLDGSVPHLVPLLGGGMQVLEVKYDELLPDFIAQALELGTLEPCAFSKYYLGRLALRGEFPVG